MHSRRSDCFIHTNCARGDNVEVVPQKYLHTLSLIKNRMCRFVARLSLCWFRVGVRNNNNNIQTYCVCVCVGVASLGIVFFSGPIYILPV